MFDLIKQYVTIPIALTRYTNNYDGAKRIACPVHSGKDKNAIVSDTIMHCFVCNKSYDVVRIVSSLNNISQYEAAIMIENDFSLTKPDDIKSIKRKYEREKSKQERDKKIEHRAWHIITGYIRWCREQIERIKTIDDYDNDISESLSGIGYAEYVFSEMLKSDLEGRKRIIEDITEWLREKKSYAVKTISN